MKQHTLCIIHSVQQAVRTYEAELKATIGLSLNEGLCLCAVREGYCEPAAIAAQLALSPSRLSKIFEDMKTKALITRSINKDNRRNISVNLTEKGTELLTKLDSSDISFSLPQEAVQGGTDA